MGPFLLGLGQFSGVKNDRKIVVGATASLGHCPGGQQSTYRGRVLVSTLHIAKHKPTYLAYMKWG